ncbi:MAG TPA: hypothetical protein VFQ88_07945 [Nevskiaceae bacterium]|nr:hypothetical protein [Nevskiaceae bacterium]
MSAAGRRVAADFVRASSQLIERLGPDIHEVLAGDARRVVLGALSSQIKRTARTIETPFPIVLTIAEGEITRFLLLEGSFAVAAAARES